MVWCLVKHWDNFTFTLRISAINGSGILTTEKPPHPAAELINEVYSLLHLFGSAEVKLSMCVT